MSHESVHSGAINVVIKPICCKDYPLGGLQVLRFKASFLKVNSFISKYCHSWHCKHYVEKRKSPSVM